MSEAIYLVIERSASGGEVAGIYYDRLFSRLKRSKGEASPIIYQLRLDRLEPEHRDFWLSKSTEELLATYRWLRDEGTLPAANIADPPRPKEEQGSLRGPENWWKPPVPPRGQDWTP